MINKEYVPYVCHIFVCTNDRKGEEKSCSDGDSDAIRLMLKKEVKSRNWLDLVRISSCDCLGICKEGPNVVIYPQKIIFSDVKESAIPEIMEKVESLLPGRAISG